MNNMVRTYALQIVVARFLIPIIGDSSGVHSACSSRLVEDSCSAERNGSFDRSTA